MIRKLASDQHVFMQGDAHIRMHFIASGAVRLYRLRSSGQRQVLGFKYTGDFIELGESATHRFNAQAMTSTVLRILPRANFRRAAQNDPSVSFRLYRAIDADLLSARALILNIAQGSAEESVAAFLLDLDQRTRGRANASELTQLPMTQLPMTRSDIADYLGLTTETVSRVFTKLRKRGILEVRGHRLIRIADHAALRAAAGNVGA